MGSPGDCPVLFVGFEQSWGHPLSAAPANWYSPDMPTTFEQRLPVIVSRILIENLPVNSQFADEALRFPWLAKGGPGNTNSTSHRWPNSVVVPPMPKGPVAVARTLPLSLPGHEGFAWVPRASKL
jgi:hypothetical protein